MIEALPTGWRGQTLAAGLTLAMLAAVYVTVVAPLLQFYADRAVLIETRQSLQLKLDAVAAELPALRARIDELRAGGKQVGTMTFGGATDAIATAALQGRIAEFAGSAGVTIGSSESLPAETRGPYRRLGLRLVLSGSYDSFVKLLAQIEEATPPLIVSNLQIRSVQRRGVAAAVGALDGSLEIVGFRAEER